MKAHRILGPSSAVAGFAAVVLLAGCSSSSGGMNTGSRAGASKGIESTVNVVASTSVYGDIAKQIGGFGVTVTSIITDPAQDPHSYEANTRTQLELSRADIVVENGGGYDDFVDRMLSSAGKSPTVINVVKLSGKAAPAGGELNEHVWYDFPTMQKLAGVLVKDLSATNSSGAATYQANAAAFTAKLKTLESTEASIKAAHAGAGVAITEPVPLYLLDACGLVNKTPAKFSEAIEEGEGVPVRVLNETLALFSSRSVELLAYNEQTTGPETERVLAAAKEHAIAVVPVTETLPRGKDYIGWMSDTLAAVNTALG